jgi:maltose-binding protein MalE
MIGLLLAASLYQTTLTPGHSALSASATPAETPSAVPRPLILWWPAPIYPSAKTAALALLTTQLADFEADRSVQVEMRVKRADGVGGIYQSLRSGAGIAPSVMPDLVLLRRDDLVQAVTGKLVQGISDLPRRDLFSASLGQVGEVQYGIPYMIEINHLVYRADQFTTPPTKFEDLSSAVMLFTGSASNNVLLLCQYTAAGGRVSSDKGAPVLDAAPLQSVLAYYENALKEKRVGQAVLDYSTSSQYWPIFLNDHSTVAEISSTTYLAEHANLPNISAMQIPTLDGSAITSLDGWMFVIVTPDADRQRQALDLITWLMDADRHGKLSQQLGILPATRAALDTWQTDPYAAFARGLLDGRIAPFDDSVPPVVNAALQHAFEDVITGRKTAQAAVSDAVGTVPGSQSGS